MTNENCFAVRELLQEAYDRGAAPDASCVAHLAGCAGCRAFGEFLSTYPAGLAGAIDARCERCGAPDFTAVAAGALAAKNRHRRRVAVSLSGLAAAAVLGLMTILAIPAVERAQIERSVREENSRFVEELFDDSAFEGIEYLTVSR